MGIKGDLKTAEEAKSAAEATAQSAKGGTSKLESDNQKLSNDIQTLQGQFAKATNDLGAAQATLASPGRQAKWSLTCNKLNKITPNYNLI